VFGGQAGYNWQRGNFVGGIEIDYSFADLKETQSFSETFVPDIHVDAVAPAPVTTTWSLHTKVDALASARARAGFLIGPDFYIYGTGGIGWARSKANVDRDRCIGGECLNVFAASAVENNFGWVAGAGAEYRLWQNVSLGVTYLHYDFGSTNYAFSVAERPITFSVKSDLTVDVVRGALNFRF
jgi:outer membrane immunogenic protein